MSLPKLDRNKLLVRMRNKNPEKWSWDALRSYFKFKSRGTPKRIYDTFSPRFTKQKKVLVDNRVHTP